MRVGGFLKLPGTGCADGWRSCDGGLLEAEDEGTGGVRGEGEGGCGGFQQPGERVLGWGFGCRGYADKWRAGSAVGEYGGRVYTGWWGAGWFGGLPEWFGGLAGCFAGQGECGAGYGGHADERCGGSAGRVDAAVGRGGCVPARCAEGWTRFFSFGLVFEFVFQFLVEFFVFQFGWEFLIERWFWGAGG